MRLSTSTNIYFNRPGGGKADIRDSIRLCAQAGYQVMDMNFHDCATFDTPFRESGWEAWVESVGETARQCGIVFSQGHSEFYNWCDPALPDREQKETLVRRSVVAAGALGIPWLVIHAATDLASATPVRTSREKNLEYLRPLLELAGRHGVGLAIENLWEGNIAPLRRYTSTAEELVELVDRLPYPNVGVCWDAEHASFHRQDQAAALRLIGGRLKATHISDFTHVNNDHILPFSGVTDWAPILKALGEIGYAGDLTYEIHRYTENLPDELVPSALRHSVAVGEYLLSLVPGQGGKE